MHPSQMFYKLLLIQAGAVGALLQVLVQTSKDDLKGQVHNMMIRSE